MYINIYMYIYTFVCKYIYIHIYKYIYIDKIGFYVDALQQKVFVELCCGACHPFAPSVNVTIHYALKVIQIAAEHTSQIYLCSSGGLGAALEKRILFLGK